MAATTKPSKRQLHKKHLRILSRRMLFLEHRLSEREDYAGDSFDEAELAALRAAVEALQEKGERDGLTS